jgi:hypothetical protein
MFSVFRARPSLIFASSAAAVLPDGRGHGQHDGLAVGHAILQPGIQAAKEFQRDFVEPQALLCRNLRLHNRNR